MDMTRFEDGDDPGFKAVAGELRRWVKQLIAPSDAAMPEAVALQPQQGDPGVMEDLPTSESESWYSHFMRCHGFIGLFSCRTASILSRLCTAISA